MVFEENDSSVVGQVDMCAGDEIPQDAIGRMGVGFFRLEISESKLRILRNSGGYCCADDFRVSNISA